MRDVIAENQQFTKTLETWQVSSGKTLEQISELSVNFQFRDGKIAPSSLTKTKNGKPPTTKQGRANLYTLLGVIHAFVSLDSEKVRHFLQTYEISYELDYSWEELWAKMEEGSEKCRSRKKRQYQRSILIRLATAVACVLGIIAIIILNRQNVKDFPECLSTSDGILPPLFRPEQGFSQYQKSADIQSGAIVSDQVRSLAINENGLWVGYAPTAEIVEGISLFNHELWRHCRGVEFGGAQFVNGFAFGFNEVFVATDGLGILRLNGSGWSSYSLEEGDLPTNIIYELYRDPDGVLWAATYQGILRYASGKWVVAYQSAEDELASNQVHTFLRDGEGNLWFGHVDRGISRLTTSGEWSNYFTFADGARSIRRSAIDNSGGIWFATDGGGVLRYQNGQWVHFTTENGLPSNHTNDVEIDMFGRIWVGTDEGLIYTSNFGDTWQIHSTNPIWDIEFGCSNCKYGREHMWLALRNGGIGHVRIPPLIETIRIVSTPISVALTAGQAYVFEVEIQVMGEYLTEDNGDSLRALTSNEGLYGAYPIIPFSGSDLNVGSTYSFTNIDNPIIAPESPGLYQTIWRVWQGKRFVSAPIIVEFSVIES
jgi:hypothetical protein